MQNMILDLYGPDTSADTIRELREEAARVLEESGGSWTREAVQNLKLIDSAIREAMRITPFACIGLPRTVIHPDGITIEAADDKVHIPCGMVFAAPLEGVHHDEDIYPDSRRYKPFRFVGREASHHTSGPKKEAVGAADNRTDRSGSQNDRSSVTLDEDFLSFGIGKHACPGRFFAVNEMKLFVAHMLLNYDVECLSRRPKARTFGWIRLPYNDGQVRVRKRSAGFKEESEVMSNGRT
ncbi:Ent-kaurene oxidase [Daldinia childiae]|uniref:Ent-kaurene oxidase n=1 Tax=Daldinia childiae TaxID=326645 RepID=UPI0014475313|nr:Ent-kaurene oxidase [Daldinia childiae]KAF3066380.1 Ent-kaurene oxidase [Daldinia childiae]